MIILLLFAGPASGCATLAALLPEVITKVTDAMLIISQVEAVADDFFATFPDPEKAKLVDAAIRKTRTALNVALRAAKGAGDLTEDEVDAAFENFAVAYRELISLCSTYGVPIREGDPSDPKFAATPGVQVVPEPLALIE